MEASLKPFNEDGIWRGSINPSCCSYDQIKKISRYDEKLINHSWIFALKYVLARTKNITVDDLQPKQWGSIVRCVKSYVKSKRKHKTKKLINNIQFKSSYSSGCCVKYM